MHRIRATAMPDSRGRQKMKCSRLQRARTLLGVEGRPKQGKAAAGQVDVVLKGGRRVPKPLAELIPSTAGRAGEHITLRASRPIVSQALYGDGAWPVVVPSALPSEFENAPATGHRVFLK